jgi:hypothetical protein
MSLSLNPALWPIDAFGSCNINRHLQFSYRLTVLRELNETIKLHIVMCYCTANVITRHTQTHCVLYVGSEGVMDKTDRRNGTEIRK